MERWRLNPILLKEQNLLPAIKYNEATVQATYCIQVMIRRLIITCAGKFLPHPDYPEVISKDFKTTVNDDMKIQF